MEAKNKTFECDYCGYNTYLKSNLIGHIRSHTGERPFQCILCDSKHSFQYQLKMHIIAKHPEFQILQCTQCNYKCIEQKHLERHSRKHDKKSFNCDICGYKCIHYRHFTQHMATHQKSYKCIVCHKTFAFSWSLKRHTMTHTGEKPYKCSLCDYKCIQPRHLKRHEIMKHPEEIQGIMNVNTSNNIQDVTSHEEQHEQHTEGSKRKLEFDINFKSTAQTEMHDTLMNTFECFVCHRIFPERSDLKKHTMSHTGEMPYQCSQCDYKCLQKGQLKQHEMMKHTELSPYKCETCNKKFRTKNHLNRHIQTHTGEKPFSCNKCEYKCAQKGQLKSHLKRKHLVEKT